MSTFIIAEAGVNHNGDLALAHRLVKVAASSGADAVKFQTFSADKLTSKGAQKAEYQKQTTGDGSQYEMLKALELSDESHRELARLCVDLGIEFMSTAFDEDSLDLLVELGIRRIKVPSGELTNHPFLRFMASKNLPMILSTGMADLAEVEAAVAIIAEERQKLGLIAPLTDILTILQCTSNYPASISDVNLRAMLTMGHATGMPIGYSDHTLGLTVSAAAVAMGATVIEKHFTLDKTMPGPDHAASLNPEELAALVKEIRSVETAFGDGVKAPAASEVPVRELVRRSVTAARPIAAGSVISAGDLTLMRPGWGIEPKDLDAVIGRRAERLIQAGQTLAWTDLS